MSYGAWFEGVRCNETHKSAQCLLPDYHDCDHVFWERDTSQLYLTPRQKEEKKRLTLDELRKLNG
jgi:hypothetical protein